jgi:hypothetical protein
VLVVAPPPEPTSAPPTPTLADAAVLLVPLPLAPGPLELPELLPLAAPLLAPPEVEQLSSKRKQMSSHFIGRPLFSSERRPPRTRCTKVACYADLRSMRGHKKLLAHMAGRHAPHQKILTMAPRGVRATTSNVRTSCCTFLFVPE